MKPWRLDFGCQLIKSDWIDDPSWKDEGFDLIIDLTQPRDLRAGDKRLPFSSGGILLTCNSQRGGKNGGKVSKWEAPGGGPVGGPRGERFHVRQIAWELMQYVNKQQRGNCQLPAPFDILQQHLRTSSLNLPIATVSKSWSHHWKTSISSYFLTSKWQISRQLSNWWPSSTTAVGLINWYFILNNQIDGSGCNTWELHLLISQLK